MRISVYRALSPVLKLLTISALALFILACSRESNAPLSRPYHSMTAFFNGFYNARKLLDATTLAIEDKYIFPEHGFVDVHYYGTEDEIKTVMADLSKVTEKADIAIYKHGKGNMEDECRMLNGISWFYKQNYSLALQNFNYVLDNFARSQEAPHAHLWIARTYLASGNLEGARSAIEDEIVFKRSLKLDEEMKAELAIILSKIAIQDKKYNKAIDELVKGLPYIKRRREAVKAHYLLGQLYSAVGKQEKALDEYSFVAKKSDKYDLTFKAKMMIARTTTAMRSNGNGDSAEAQAEMEKILKKMIKDEKNNDFRDQIYYELGMMSLAKRDYKTARDLFRASVKANTVNKRQKALSYYKIGKLSFDHYRDFPVAQAYYDSAAAAIQKNAPEYEEITRIAGTLKDYIKYVTTIQYQDSMLALSKLSKADLDKKIEKIMDEERIRKEKEQEEMLAEMAKLTLQAANSSGLQAQGGGWYYDNPQNIANGKIQFDKNWGVRKNEDHWRRSRKSIVSTETVKAAPLDSNLVKEYGDKAKYYRDIPTTPERQDSSRKSIETALYNLGQIYHTKLQAPDSATAVFERLLKRFPETEYDAPAHYTLYTTYKATQEAKAQPHKAHILTKYPKSVYALLLQGKNPDEARAEIGSFRSAYNGLVEMYSLEQYNTCISFSYYITNNFKEEGDISFAGVYYIRGMSHGFIGQKDSLRKYLVQVTTQYPKAECTPVARKTLEFMDGGGKPAAATKNPAIAAAAPTPTDEPKAGGAANDPTDPKNPMYKDFKAEVNPTDKVVVILYVETASVNKTELQTKIADFNSKNYKASDLKTFIFAYKNTHWMPYVSTFATIADAKKYVDFFKSDPLAQELLMNPGEKIMYISQGNFKSAYGQKKMAEYIQYYDNILDK